LGLFISDRRDLSWLAYIAALTVTALIALALVRLLRCSKWLLSSTLVIIAVLFCIAGSILITNYPDNVLLLSLGGATCGIGTVALAPAFYASLVRFNRWTLLTVFLLVALCMALLSTVLYLLPMTIITVIVTLFPAATGVATIYLLLSTPKIQKRCCEKPAIDDAIIRSSFYKDLVTCSFALFFSSLFSCITGFATDIMPSEQFLSYYLILNVLTCLMVAVILFIVKRALAFEFLIFICFLVQATATLMLPFIAGVDGSSVVATSLNAAATLLCQIIFVFLVLQHNPHTGASATYDPMRALLAVLMTGATGIPSIIIGAAVYRYLGLNSSAIAIAAIIIIYIIFLVFGVLTQKRKRVEHVLTGRFQSEAELADYRSQILAREYPSLSVRELEVLALLLRGRSAPGIAETLYISENTAKSHIQHIYKKMGISSRKELLKQTDDIPFD
jgi:DNA-binding CsgD family transcriptional regulator